MNSNTRPEDYFKNLIRELKNNNNPTIEDRKALFISYVKDACRYFKISIPSINFDTIEHFSDGEDGHFHVEECKICVDEDKLKYLKKDKIKELAYHEVTHAFIGGHDDAFWNKMKKALMDN